MQETFSNTLEGQLIYITHKIFDEDYAAIDEIKPILMLNKPIYVGFTTLDLSKWKMYDFHYKFIKKNFHAELLIKADTDSLIYEIKSENIYEKFSILVAAQKIQKIFIALIKKSLAK